MVDVNQGAQHRYFKYDSLGRLIRVRQPEQDVNSKLALNDSVTGNNDWTAAFEYDGVGNLVKTTDAEDTEIDYAYDKAGRVKTRTYSDGTPQVSYFYDGKGLSQTLSPNYAKGQLTKVDNGISASLTTQFDNLGRPTEYQQLTDGNTYTSKYTYNLSGALVEEEYPSGRKVKNSFDENGKLSRIHGNATPTASERTYANSFKYMPDGRIERLKIGNGLWEKAAFNDRLQVIEMGLGNGAQNLNLWKLNFGYDQTLPGGGTANTGSLVSQAITVDGLAKPFIQTYKYDTLYRITEAEEKNDNNQTWIENYGYDRYGNRTTFSQNITGNQLALNSTTHPTIDPLTNRFDPNQGYGYDKVGNLTTDKDDTGLSRDIVFNGDNKQKEIRDDATGNKIGEYEYDGNGNRVKKKVYGSNETLLETVIFVYSGGKLVEEYSTKAPPQNPTTKYVATDTLQSVRAISNQDGQVISRRDFLPFGQEIPNADEPGHSTSLRTSTLKYGYDNVRQKFTGYQKDEESGLDFAEARMYNNRHARFTAVDPLLASGKSGNPQTFNRYVYVMNSPLNYTDPTGLQVGTDNADCRASSQADCSNVEIIGTVNPDGQSVTLNKENEVVGIVNVFADIRDEQQSVLSEILTEPALSADNDFAVGFGTGIRNSTRGIGNAPWETDIIGGPAYGILANGLEGQGYSFLPRTTLNSFGYASPFTYEQPQNFNQQVGQVGGQLTFVGATVLATRGAGARFGPGAALSRLKGVPDASLSRLVRRLEGMNIGGHKVFGSIEAFGSRAGSRFRGRGPLANSDLDLLVEYRLPMQTYSSGNQNHIQRRLMQIMSDFKAETGFPVNIHSNRLKKDLDGTPFINVNSNN